MAGLAGVGAGGVGWGRGWAEAGAGLAALKRKLSYQKMQRLCPDRKNKQFLFISFLRV